MPSRVPGDCQRFPQALEEPGRLVNRASCFRETSGRLVASHANRNTYLHISFFLAGIVHKQKYLVTRYPDTEHKDVASGKEVKEKNIE